MAIRELSDARPDGQVIGRSSTDLLGFYGKTTPVARQTVTAATTTATTTTNEAAIVRLTAALVALGLIITS